MLPETSKYPNPSGESSSPEPAVATQPNERPPLLDELGKDLDRLKRQKARPTGGVEGNTLLSLCFYNDEHYVNYTKKQLGLESQDPNKLYLTFNLIAPRANKLLGRLSAFNGEFEALPDKKDPQALEDAEVCDKMLTALDRKLDETSRMRERWFWMMIGGTAFEFIPWVPNATIEPMPVMSEPGFDPTGRPAPPQPMYYDTQGDPNQHLTQQDVESAIQAGAPPEQFEIAEEVQLTGEVGSIIYGPLNVFVDQNVRSIEDLPPDAWIHVADFKTIGWIKENFDADVQPAKELSLITSRIKADGEATGGVYLKDLIPMVQGSCDENDAKMALVVQSYQPASTKQPRGKYVCWVPNDQILHEDTNPYGEIPIVDFHWSPVTTSFWTKGYVTGLISSQRFINKRLSQLGEQSNATLYSNLLLGPGLKAEDIPADYPGPIEGGLDENGTPLLGRQAPPEIPQWFMLSIDAVLKLFNDLAGGADLLSESKFPGQLRGPMAVPMLQEIIDSEWGPLFLHFGERLAKVKQMRLNRVKQFYPPVRTMHYHDRTQRDEVLTFHKEKILDSGTNYRVIVKRGSVLPELRALKEARLQERLAGPLAILYMDERTGQLDKSKISADLSFGDTGRDGREAQFRKLSLEIIKMLWQGQQPPPVQPFYAHQVMLDELEAQMSTTEFLKASPQVQQLFSARWQEHVAYIQQQAQAQQQMLMNQQIQSATAQATQMAAAKAAADTVESTRTQMGEQEKQPTEQYVSAAQRDASSKRTAEPPKKRKVTVSEEESR